MPECSGVTHLSHYTKDVSVSPASTRVDQDHLTPMLFGMGLEKTVSMEITWP